MRSLEEIQRRMAAREREQAERRAAAPRPRRRRPPVSKRTRERVAAAAKRRERAVAEAAPGLHPARARRLERELTQAEVAAKAGVHPDTVARIETGRLRPRLVTRRALAKALNMSPDFDTQSQRGRSND